MVYRLRLTSQSEGCTALHYAAYMGNAAAVEFLLDVDCNPLVRSVRSDWTISHSNFDKTALDYSTYKVRRWTSLGHSSRDSIIAATIHASATDRFLMTAAGSCARKSSHGEVSLKSLLTLPHPTQAGKSYRCKGYAACSFGG